MNMAHQNHQGISLAQLLDGFCDQPGLTNVSLEDLSLSSHHVVPGGGFVACQGGKTHGLAYAKQALERGAVVILYEPTPAALAYLSDIKKYSSVALIPVVDLSLKIGEIAARFFGHPSRLLRVIGITGTDGKTSCSQFIAQALSYRNEPCGVIGTIGYGIYGQLAEASHTTPDAIRVHSLFLQLLTQGARYVAMEVSSHALDQGRVHGVDFEVAVLTNLTRDHLDYHGTVEQYARAKEKLFEFESARTLVLNLDDEFGMRLAKEYSERKTVYGYSISTRFNELLAQAPPGVQLIHAQSLSLMRTGLRFKLICPWGEAWIDSPLYGAFNVSNMLAVFASLTALQMSFSDVCLSLGQLRRVDGRMEQFGGQNQPQVFVDYAHTPKALEQVLNALRAHGHTRISCVFGCGGDRDTGKRPQMGAVVASLADRIFVTDDNPRSEAPHTIVEAILSGITPVRGLRDVVVEHNRARAIEMAIQQADANDVVLIAGKGHEDYQIIGNEKRYFSDRKLVIEQLNKRPA